VTVPVHIKNGFFFSMW